MAATTAAAVAEATVSTLSINDAVVPAKDTSSDYYFDSYSHFGIHEEMLKDKVRTQAYRRAILENKHLFKDKIVMDVGCGTGILSMFAVQAGAKHVYAIEKASIHLQATQIIAENGMSDSITVIHTTIEELMVLPHAVQTVDIIISEWMGYFLLYESMLDSVIVARDRFLVKDGSGILMPDKATMYLMGIEDAEYRQQKVSFWNSVYGFKMTAIQNLVLSEPLIDMCEAKQIITQSYPILDIDLYTITHEQLNFSAKFNITASRADSCHALVGYFNCIFSKTHTQVMWSTSPRHDYTHWKQTVFYLPAVLKLSLAQKITGSITVSRNAINKRELDISITASTDSAPKQLTKEYKLR